METNSFDLKDKKKDKKDKKEKSKKSKEEVKEKAPQLKLSDFDQFKRDIVINDH
jgi:hypothetical protein